MCIADNHITSLVRLGVLASILIGCSFKQKPTPSLSEATHSGLTIVATCLPDSNDQEKASSIFVSQSTSKLGRTLQVEIHHNLDLEVSKRVLNAGSVELIQADQSSNFNPVASSSPHETFFGGLKLSFQESSQVGMPGPLKSVELAWKDETWNFTKNCTLFKGLAVKPTPQATHSQQKTPNP